MGKTISKLCCSTESEKPLNLAQFLKYEDYDRFLEYIKQQLETQDFELVDCIFKFANVNQVYDKIKTDNLYYILLFLHRCINNFTLVSHIAYQNRQKIMRNINIIKNI